MLSGVPVRVGIVAGEFLQPGISRIGGYGWSASRAAAVLRDAGDEPIYICSDVEALVTAPVSLDGVPLIAKQASVMRFVRELRRSATGRVALDRLPAELRHHVQGVAATPLIVWVRDPRPPEDVAAVARYGSRATAGRGASGARGDRLHAIADDRASVAPAPSAAPVCLARTRCAHPESAGDVWRSILAGWHCCPTRSTWPASPARRRAGRRSSSSAASTRTSARGCSQSLPRSFPEADFVMLGQSHFRGPGSWEPHDLPGNLQLGVMSRARRSFANSTPPGCSSARPCTRHSR